MTKLGTQFELVVADVVKELDPNASVKQGEWVQGPDGYRELDIIVEGTFNGANRRIQIECKDYNPVKRVIGIGTVDALESKHRDLGMDLSLLCSNAGFSFEAIEKAKRVGIGLIGVLKQGDRRIRYKLFDAVYIRRVEFEMNADITLDFPSAANLPAGLGFNDVLYQGLPVVDWLRYRVGLFLGRNPVVRGMHRLSYKFAMPVLFMISGIPRLVSGIKISFVVRGTWIAQDIAIDATCGLYDWIRKSVRLGPQSASITYENVKFGTGGKKVRSPPSFNPNRPEDPGSRGIAITLLDLGGLDIPKTYPDLDKCLRADQNDLRRYDLSVADCVSW